MREEYIAMRLSGQFDLTWFYRYYVSEFPNIPQTWINQQGETLNRELIPAQQFFQVFQLTFQMYSEDVLKYLDGKFNTTRTEDKDGKLIHIS